MKCVVSAQKDID